MGGIVGEGVFSPWLEGALAHWAPAAYVDTLAFALSFVVVTSLFILFADLMPKRLGMAAPERLAMAVAAPAKNSSAWSRRSVGAIGGMERRLMTGLPWNDRA